jgi:phage tail-like protein
MAAVSPNARLSTGPGSAPAYPFTTFSFAVEIEVDGMDNKMVCNAAFSECDGLDMTMEVKTIRQGGDNATQIRLAGPLSYSQVTLRRGMTSTFDLWDWFSATVDDPTIRGHATVVLFAADGQTERVRFLLSRCIPVKLKAPALNAKEAAIAIEEMQIAYEQLTTQRPGGGGGSAFGPGVTASASLSIGG